MTTFKELLIKQYAIDIYCYGIKRLNTINEIYVESVKVYAAANIQRLEIDTSLDKGYITKQEHTETIALISVA